MAKVSKEDIIASLKEYTVVELFDLVTAIETEFGVKAAAAVAAAAPSAKKDEGPSEVTVTLTGFTGSKVAVIKAVQGITGLGLMEAKKLVDVLPAKIKEKVAPAEAEDIKKKLEAATGTVEVK